LRLDRSLVTAVNTLADQAGRTSIDDEQVGGVESPEFDTQLMSADGRVQNSSDESRCP
jgi:hypothetical protein